MYMHPDTPQVHCPFSHPRASWQKGPRAHQICHIARNSYSARCSQCSSVTSQYPWREITAEKNSMHIHAEAQQVHGCPAQPRAAWQESHTRTSDLQSPGAIGASRSGGEESRACSFRATLPFRPVPHMQGPLAAQCSSWSDEGNYRN